MISVCQPHSSPGFKCLKGSSLSQRALLLPISSATLCSLSPSHATTKKSFKQISGSDLPRVLTTSRSILRGSSLSVRTVWHMCSICLTRPLKHFKDHLIYENREQTQLTRHEHWANNFPALNLQSRGSYRVQNNPGGLHKWVRFRELTCF